MEYWVFILEFEKFQARNEKKETKWVWTITTALKNALKEKKNAIWDSSWAQ